MTNEALILTNSYWDVLKSLRDDVKLLLASRLTASVVEKPVRKPACTEEMLNKFCGALQD